MVQVRSKPIPKRRAALKAALLSPIKMPAADVLFECLNLYQTDFRKPSLTVYCLDYSGSMSGEGNEQLVQAMEQLLIQERTPGKTSCRHQKTR